MVALLLLLGVPLAEPAAAQQNLIVDQPQIHGNRRIPADTIRARMYTRAGDTYDEATLQRDFMSLWNTGYFEDVRIEREEAPNGWRIHVYVRERPTIRRLDYRGLNSVSQSDLLTRFRERKVGLTVESQYDPTRVKRAEVVIKQMLAENGRQFANVRAEIRPLPPAAVELVFVIDEGPKVRVGNIEFEGNQRVGDRTLRRAMANSKPIGIPHSIFLENLFARTFNAEKLGEDAERIRYEYQNRGYFKALVADPQTQVRDRTGMRIPLFRPGGKVVDITVPIEEGERYRLHSITFEGHSGLRDPKMLRGLFPIADGEIFSREKIAKGLDNLRKAYGEVGHINFTAVPNTVFDDDELTIKLEVDVDEGKQFSVRRIEFTGNTTTRDKVIRRELALEEGGLYNSRLWELSVLRLNQLAYFEQLKPEDDSEIRRNEQQAEVDIELKVKEKGKNSIGLTGGVSGIAGSFIGINYETNNFLGLGETLRVEANVGSRERNLLFGFTEPYLFDRPIQFGFTVFNRRFNFNELRQSEILSGRRVDLDPDALQFLQDFRENTTGFNVSASYQLRRSFNRIGLTYAWDTSTTTVFTEASRQYFQLLNFRPGSLDPLRGVVNSRILPSFSRNTVNHPYRPTSGTSVYLGGEITGLGGNVRYTRPILEFKQFRPMRRTHVLGYRVQASFISGWGGQVAPPMQRFYGGGDTDVRGFDQRSITPWTLIPNVVQQPLQNPDGSPVLRDPSNPNAGQVTVPVPVYTLARSGGDTSLVGNVEYRVPIVGPVTLAAFADIGTNFVARESQLRLSDVHLEQLQSARFGCPIYDVTSCIGGQPAEFRATLPTVSGTNFVPRMSTGLELQVILPVVNAPFRIYYAYNPLRLDTFVNTPVQITRDMFPVGGAGDFSFAQALSFFGTNYRLREPRRTVRFTVSTTF